MEPKPKERIVFDEDLYYGDEGEEMAINDLMERDGLTEDEVREDFTDDEIFNHQMEMKDFALHPVSVRATFSPTARFRRSGTRTARFTLPVPTMTGAYPSRCVSSPMRANAFGDSSITRIICPSKGLPPWESTIGLALRTGSFTTSITARNSAPPPRYVEQSFGCPSEEYEKEEGTLPHDFTTGKWRVHLIYPGERYGLDGCLTYELNAYSGAPAAAHRASYPLVEFYDTSQDAARFPGGQFVSRYYMTDLLEDNSIAVSLDTMLKNGNQFSLDGGIPAWTVEGDDLAKVNDFLKKSCMEFSGSLPGDEKDEDGYSLSGEAKDATASRNGLSRNQMGIEEKAAECKEAATVLANGNAL